MTDHSADTICKFTGEIVSHRNRHVIALPEREIKYGMLNDGDVVQITVELIARSAGESRSSETAQSAPVSVGDRRTVEIDDVGEQGDGIARVDRGYVLIVPETAPGDVVDIEVTDTKSNVGFAEVVEKEDEMDVKNL